MGAGAVLSRPPKHTDDSALSRSWVAQLTWVSALAFEDDAAGQERLADTADFVRREITIAFDRSITVMPVLVGGATMPDATVLPSVLRPLVQNGVALQPFPMHDEGWIKRLDRLVATIHTQLDHSDRRREAALAVWERRRREWRGVVRGDLVAVYGMIRELMVSLYPIPARRGLLLGKAPQEIILIRRVRDSLFVRFASEASARYTEVLIRGDPSDIERLAREVVATRLVELKTIR